MPTPEHLFVGGFWHGGVDEESLLALVRPYGAITRHVLRGNYAFVYYEEPGATAAAAAALDGHIYNGAKLGARVQGGDTARVEWDGKGTSVFVGGLPLDVSETLLRGFTEPYGTVKRIILKKGFAFVVYVEKTEAEVAVAALSARSDVPYTFRVQNDANRAATTAVRELTADGAMAHGPANENWAQGEAGQGCGWEGDGWDWSTNWQASNGQGGIQSTPPPALPPTSVVIGGFGTVPHDEVESAVSTLAAAYGKDPWIEVQDGTAKVTFEEGVAAAWAMVRDFPTGSDWQGRHLTFSVSAAEGVLGTPARIVKAPKQAEFKVDDGPQLVKITGFPPKVSLTDMQKAAKEICTCASGTMLDARVTYGGLAVELSSEAEKEAVLTATREGVVWGTIRLQVTAVSERRPGSALRVARVTPRTTKRDLWIVFSLVGQVLHLELNSIDHSAIVDYVTAGAAAEAIGMLKGRQVDGVPLVMTELGTAMRGRYIQQNDYTFRETPALPTAPPNWYATKNSQFGNVPYRNLVTAPTRAEYQVQDKKEKKEKKEKKDKKEKRETFPMAGEPGSERYKPYG